MIVMEEANVVLGTIGNEGLMTHEGARIREVFQQAGIEQHMSEHVVVMAMTRGGTEAEIIGAITVANGDELSVAVVPERQREGIGTAMLKEYLDTHAGAFLVAGTEAGAAWLWSLQNSMTKDEIERLDVPSWGNG